MATLSSAVIELVIGGTVLIYGEGSAPVITQTLTNDTNTVPSNRVINDELNKKANKTLASDTQDGLLSKEHYKLLTDMANELPEIAQQLTNLANKNNCFYDPRLVDTIVLTPADRPEGFVSDVFSILSKEAGQKVHLSTRNYSATREAPVDKRLRYSIYYDSNQTPIILSGQEILRFDSNSTSKFYKGIQVMSNNIEWLEVYSTGLEFIDIIGAVSLKRLSAGRNEYPTIDLSYCTQLEKAYINSNPNIKRLNFTWNPLLKEISAHSNPSLIKLTMPPSSENLTWVAVNGTALSKTEIINIGNAWTDRTGKESGAIDISSDIYGQLTAAEKQIFTNKNINIVSK